MSLDQQVALTRATRGESTHLSKAARQVVPPFLQKLYEIVSDSRNEELIRWSENGDSFYVLNHERFAREVLGRWFKHQKFTSFVRQLNMYGFHKIPQLQQGVLKSDSDTEPWHFEHPHFHRGQPDLLCLIQRKKQPAHGGDDAAMDYAEAVNASVPIGGVPNGQLMDINAIVNGIATIKRHQQAISDDLNDLKKANDVLWAEAVESRKRHEKHEDTINRILKFLAGVFGSAADHVRKTDKTPSPHAVVPRMRQMLLIGDGAAMKGKGVHLSNPIGVHDEREDNRSTSTQERSETPFSIGEQYASIETPEPSLASPSVTPTETFSPTLSRPTPEYVQSPEVPRSDVYEPESTPEANGNPGNKAQVHNSPLTTPALTPAVANGSGLSSADSAWQAALQQMLNSPAQMQKLMHVLSNQHGYPVQAPLEPPHIDSEQYSQIMPYDPHHGDLSHPPSHPSSHSSSHSSSHPPSHSPSLSSHSSHFHPDVPSNGSGSPASIPLLGSPSRSSDHNALLGPLLENSNRIENSYRAAADIDADMDVIQTSINSLIQDMGIDPHSIQTPPHQGPPVSSLDGTVGPVPGTMQQPSAMYMDGPQRDTSTDFDFDALLNEFSNRTDQGDDYADIINRYNPLTRIDGTRVADASTEQLTAFLDEVSDTNSPHTHSPPDLKNGGVAGRKRKSGAADVAPIPPTSSLEFPQPGPKTKRKR